jgi:dihydrofolate reductase
MKELSIILATTFNGGIGSNNALPWYIPEEMKKFKTITSSTVCEDKWNAVIMGRKTFDSLSKPLSGRINIVISRNKQTTDAYPQPTNVFFISSEKQALRFCEEHNLVESIFVIGGAVLLNSFMNNNCYISKVYLSVIYNHTIETDTYINMLQFFERFKFEKDIRYQKESNSKLFASFIGYHRVSK